MWLERGWTPFGPFGTRGNVQVLNGLATDHKQRPRKLGQLPNSCLGCHRCAEDHLFSCANHQSPGLGCATVPSLGSTPCQAQTHKRQVTQTCSISSIAYQCKIHQLYSVLFLVVLYQMHVLYRSNYSWRSLLGDKCRERFADVGARNSKCANCKLQAPPSL